MALSFRPLRALPLFLLPLAGGHLCAQVSVVESQRVFEAQSSTLDKFGHCVALEGDWGLVGAYGKFGAEGRAHFLRRSGTSWLLDQEVSAALPLAGAGFGWDVALAGTSAFLSAPFGSSASGIAGQVHVFELGPGGWSQTQVLTASDGQLGNDFGREIAAAGDVLVAGVPNHQVGTEFFAGASYVFRRTPAGWVEEQKLLSGSVDLNDQFGEAVATDGVRILVGENHDQQQAHHAGAAYVFVHDGTQWVQEAELFSSQPGVAHDFGSAVAIEGDVLAVSSRQNQGLFGGLADFVELYRREASGWHFEQLLQPQSSSAADLFGWTLDLDGGRLVASRPASDIHQFHFDGSQWVEVQRWIADDPMDGSVGINVGRDVALSGDTLFGGGRHGDASGFTTGALYVYAESELALDALPDEGAVGQPLELRTGGGLAGTPTGLFVTQVGGLPLLAPLAPSAGLFDAQGVHAWTFQPPAALAGLSVGLQAVGLWNPSSLGVSNELIVAFF